MLVHVLNALPWSCYLMMFNLHSNHSHFTDEKTEAQRNEITELGSGENSLLSSEATVIPSLVSAFSVMPGKTHLCVAIKSNRVKSVRNDIEHLHCALRTVQITNESTFKSTCIYI